MKPIKLGAVKEVRELSGKRLSRLLEHGRFVVSIRKGTKPDEIARIFRVLATYIDDTRQTHLKNPH